MLRLCGAAAPSAEEQSFGMRTVAAAVGALQIEISNVHVRYEDETSDPSSPFAFGLTLDRLSLHSVDGQWRPTPAAQVDLAALAYYYYYYYYHYFMYIIYIYIYICVCVYTHTHTHTHIYIHIYRWT